MEWFRENATRLELATALTLLGLLWGILRASGFLGPTPDARMSALEQRDVQIVQQRDSVDHAQDDRQARIEGSLEALIRLECVRTSEVYRRLARLECSR